MDVPECELLIRRHRLPVPHRGAEPRGKLARAERFGKIVVRPGLQAPDDLLLRVSHRKDQDRHASPLADAPQHLFSVKVRKSKIKDDRLGTIHGRMRNPFLAAGGLSYLVPLCLQRDLQQPAHLRFIVDDEDDGKVCHAVTPLLPSVVSPTEGGS